MAIRSYSGLEEAISGSKEVIRETRKGTMTEDWCDAELFAEVVSTAYGKYGLEFIVKYVDVGEGKPYNIDEIKLVGCTELCD